MSIARQAELFDKPNRRPRRRLMHVTDVRNDAYCVVEMSCSKCGYQSGWIACRTITEAKCGLPCPRCNPAPQEQR